MTARTLTLIDQDGGVRTAEAEVVDGAVRVAASALPSATGWSVEPQGLCRGDVCVPLRGRSLVDEHGSLDLTMLADTAGLPFALELDGPEGPVAVLADAGTDRTAALSSGVAPAFTLPDLDGNPVSLKDFDRRKRLLLAWASW